MRFSLTLPQHQARLLYLAVVYHLARPGSEVAACRDARPCAPTTGALPYGK